MANQRLTKQGILSHNKDAIIASLANNETWSVLIARYGVAKPSFAAFVKKHRAEIDALKAKVAERIHDVALKDKEARIRNYVRMIGDIEALIQRRTAGLEAVDYRGLGQGENYEIREVRRFDAAIVEKWLNLHQQIANELGQIPRPDNNTTVNVGILVRQLQGYDPEAIG